MVWKWADQELIGVRDRPVNETRGLLMSQDHSNDSKSSTAVSGPEALSALMDGELSAFEYRRLNNELESHPEWLDHWERFHLIRDGLRAEPWAEPLPSSQSRDSLSLSERIAADVANETPVQQTGPLVNKANAGRWWQVGGRVAVAATVALAVFAGMQNMLSTEGSGSASPAMAWQNQSESSVPMTAETQSSAQLNQNIANTASVVDQDAQRRLNDYIRSVSIPSRTAEESTPFNILRESPLLRPVSDRELLPVPQSTEAVGQQ